MSLLQVERMRKSAQPPLHERDLTVVCISDTHELHREIELPHGDILIHAGDFTMFSKSPAAIADFNEWLGEQSHPHKVVVPGNHEFFLEAEPAHRSLLSNAIVLIHESLRVMGLHIWGSPTTPLYGGAFGLSAPRDRSRLYATIPQDVDILVTHGPPYGVLDRSPGTLHHAGDPELLHAVTQLQPRLHVFGHIHGAQGSITKDETLMVNAAMLTLDGGIRNFPVVLRMPRMKAE
jgi:Icc-related predicted phosphoesterase